jgi:hypothetical protein
MKFDPHVADGVVLRYDQSQPHVSRTAVEDL